MPKAAGGAKKWLLIGLAAVLVIAGGVTAAVLLTRPTDTGPAAPATPTGLTAVANGREVTLTWNGSTGATGYTLSRSGDTAYTGVATRYEDTKLLPGKYNYTVTASNAAGKQSVPSQPVYVTVTDPWGPVAFVVDDFPDLLPATPSDTGYGDSTCSIASDTEDSKADGIISCTDPDGVYFEVMHFPAAADKDAYLQRDWSNAPVQVTWNIDGVDKGKLYRSADDEAKLPYIITTFTDDDRVQYLLYVHWQDHTLTDLMDNWWKPATF